MNNHMRTPSAAAEKNIDLKLILSILAAGSMTFGGIVVETAMNVTFPTLMKEFQINTATVQWITTGYLFIVALIIPLSAYLKRTYKMKTLFAAASLLFIAGTVLCAAAPDFGLLLAGRLIQGAGTGIALPLMFNIILEQVPLSKLGLMIGIATLITGTAPAAGPLAGGYIVKIYSWRMIFVFLLPLLLCSFLIGMYSIRQIQAAEKTVFQFKQYCILVIAFSLFIFAVNRASYLGFAHMQILSLFLLTAFFFFLFFRTCKKSESPLININIFKNSFFVASLTALFMIIFICLGLGFIIPNYAQLVYGENSFIAGCLLLPGCICAAVLAPAAGKIYDRFSPKLPILGGCAGIVLSLVLFSCMAQTLHNGNIIFFYLLFAAGQGLAFGTTTTNALRQLSEKEGTDANAIINTMQQMAAAFGTSFVSTIISASQTQQNLSFAEATKNGTQNALLLLVCCAGIAFACNAYVVLCSPKNSAPHKPV